MSRGLFEKFSIFNLGRGYVEKNVKGDILRSYYLDELILLTKIHDVIKYKFGIDMD
jgi:hypothetical protein